MLQPRAYGKFGNITLIEFPSDEAPDSRKNLEMYNAFDILLSRFKHKYRFLYYFCRDILDYGMKEHTETKSFMDNYVYQKLNYGRTLPADVNYLVKILSDDEEVRSVGKVYTEEMVDEFVDNWRDYMVKKFNEYYFKFSSILDELRQSGRLDPDLSEPYNLIATMVSYVWNDSIIVKPELDTIKRMVMSHTKLVLKEIDEVEWYIREKFLTIQWAKDYRITSWEEAKSKAKFQSVYEKIFVRSRGETRMGAREQSKVAAEDYFYQQEDSEDFKYNEFRMLPDAHISAHIFALMKKKCVIKDEKKKKKNIPRRKKVIKKEEEEGGFFF